MRINAAASSARACAPACVCRVAVKDEHNRLHKLECKCYLSSREHHFVLCTGWSALTKQSGVALGDAVVFSRVGQGRFRVERVKGGV